jgi:hypothetical protein
VTRPPASLGLTRASQASLRMRRADFPPDGTIVDHEWGRSLYVPAPDGTIVQIDEPDPELYT